MMAWQMVWRQGIAPGLSTRALVALQHALETDDPRLLQGATTAPPPLQTLQDWPVEQACPLGYCGWQGEGLQTIGEVEAYFAQAFRQADDRLGDLASVRFFLNWWDDGPRGQTVALLLDEVRGTLAERGYHATNRDEATA